MDAQELVGKAWWAFGFASESPVGTVARGTLGEIVSDEWVRVDADPTYLLEPAFSGAGIWSPDGDGIVAVLSHVDQWGDGQALSTARIRESLPGRRLSDPSRVLSPGGSIMDLATVDADVPSRVDLLGVEREAWGLARVLVARETGAPLAAALLGEWGSGKSTFMNLIETAVDRLADQANSGVRSSGQLADSLYLPGVRQVRFNAWHFADDHLWAGLIRHILDQLADDPTVDAAAQRLAARERQKLTTELASAAEELERTDAELLKAERVPRTLQVLPWPLRGRKLVEDSVRSVEQARVFAEEARQRLRLLVPIAGGLLLLGVATLIAGSEWGSMWSWLGRSTTAAGGAVAAFYGWWAHSVGVWRRRLALLVGDLAGPARPAELLALRAQHEVLSARVEDLKRQVAETDPERRLTRFLRERRESADYAAYRGLLSLVHDDLTQISQLVQQQAERWSPASSGGRPQTPPLERVVLYIDDLDRCSPEKVVEVLAAIHLILAIPLFVVVVAVDPRWLERCLQHHYVELLGDDPRAGSPIDYLEKIFQIAYVVPSMTSERTRLIRSLMPLRGADGDSSSELGAGVVPRPRVEATMSGESSEVELAAEVQRFSFSTGEVGFVEDNLATLIDTPRTLKRLVNVYRIIRVSCTDAEREHLLAHHEYELVLTLLAVALSHPYAASAFFAELRQTEATDLAGVFDASSLTGAVHQILRTQLSTMMSTGLDTEVSRYRRWLPVVARYSFRHYELEG